MWIDKETYFVIVEREMLSVPIPIEITEALGYGETIKYYGDIVWICRELEDGRWACSIQLIPEYKLPVLGIRSWITESDYNKAAQLLKALFGITEILNESEFKQLPFKEIEY